MIGKIITSAAIYLMVWWVTLFAVLPFGSVSHHEAGAETQKGNDPGAPLVSNIGKKMRINSLVALGFWAIIMLFMYLIHIPLPEIH